MNQKRYSEKFNSFLFLFLSIVMFVSSVRGFILPYLSRRQQHSYRNFHPSDRYQDLMGSLLLTTSTLTRKRVDALRIQTRAISSTSSSSQSSDINEITPEKVSTKSTPFSWKRDLGGLRRLPVVRAPDEICDRAIRSKRSILANKDISNAKLRTQKHGAQLITAVSQALCLPLRDVIQGYKSELRRLHPFERVVADLTVRARQKKDGLTLSTLLDEIHEARKEILEATKDWIARVKNAPNAKEAAATTEEGCTRLVELMQSLVAPSLKDLMELQKSLRSAPAVRLDTPAVVLVGAPNVGKSSIVRAISSATPEVNNYPFTTRGMTLGHVEVFWSDEEEIAKAVIPKTRHGNRKRLAPEVVTGKYAFSELCQIMDSPGLLSRPDEERNEMESLTMAAMQHLPTAVMYVMDLSGDAGDRCSSIKDQLELRRDIRKRFPRRPWIDVVSKFDLGVDQTILDELEVILDGAPYIKLSVQEGIGISELHREILRMLEEVRVVLDAISIVDDRSAGP